MSEHSRQFATCTPIPFWNDIDNFFSILAERTFYRTSGLLPRPHLHQIGTGQYRFYNSVFTVGNFAGKLRTGGVRPGRKVTRPSFNGFPSSVTLPDLGQIGALAAHNEYDTS